MNSIGPLPQAAGGSGPLPGTAGTAPPADARLHQAFNAFVGETFFSQMLKALRQTVGKPAYFGGGRAEEIFTQQLDQVMAQKLAQSGDSKLTGPMYNLFELQRK
ncbi:MAG: rod-binding protein [Thermoguttaceae bacterium]|jgi:Rod binding domain-containing protein